MTKKLNIIFTLLYYILGIVGFYLLFIITFIAGFVDLKNIFLMLFVILPIIVLLLPIIIKKIFKKEFYKCILFSLIAVIIYFIIFCIFLSYIGTFSESKWQNDKYTNLRYLMIDHLEEKYDFIGMNKNEVIKILGDEGGNNELCYQTRSFMISTYFYCLKYDDNNFITEIYEKEID